VNGSVPCCLDAASAPATLPRAAWLALVARAPKTLPEDAVAAPAGPLEDAVPPLTEALPVLAVPAELAAPAVEPEAVAPGAAAAQLGVLVLRG